MNAEWVDPTKVQPTIPGSCGTSGRDNTTRSYAPGAFLLLPFTSRIPDRSPLRVVPLWRGPAGGMVTRILKSHSQFFSANTASRNSGRYSVDLLEGIHSGFFRLRNQLYNAVVFRCILLQCLAENRHNIGKGSKI